MSFDSVVYSGIPATPWNNEDGIWNSFPSLVPHEMIAYNDDCYSRTFESFYSPGICPDRHTIAEMTALVMTKENESVETHYLASRCPRSVRIVYR